MTNIIIVKKGRNYILLKRNGKYWKKLKGYYKTYKQAKYAKAKEYTRRK
jgi:hypothetical protein